LEIKDLGGAELIEQKYLSLDVLLKALEDILKNRETYSKAISSFCIKDEKSDIILAQEFMLAKIMGHL
jgi:UDP-N-acetylglucosamine--N-acetylmuramyl-(pentapeptide) pyrophosphoryl-undecaprenol N-acetylglucosamine transferase